MGERHHARAVVVLGVGDWGRRILHSLEDVGEPLAGSDLFTGLHLDHVDAGDDEPPAWERFHLGLPRSFDVVPHVWLPSEVLARAPLKLGPPEDRAHARLLMVTAQRQLKGFLSLHLHRLSARMQERGVYAMEVLICASLSGITGSGALLDLAYLLRGALPVEASLGALLALPDPEAFQRGDPRGWRARAYASLLELNHFSRPDAQFDFHDPMGREHPAPEGPPLDWTFLLFPRSGRWTPRSTTADAVRWIRARATGDRFLPMLSGMRSAAELPHSFDSIRTVRLRAPSTGMLELAGIDLARRAVASWARFGPDDQGSKSVDPRVLDLVGNVSRLLSTTDPTTWTAEVNRRCETLVRAAEEAIDAGRHMGRRIWREARIVERAVFSDLAPRSRVWKEASSQIEERFKGIHATLEDRAARLMAEEEGAKLLHSVGVEMRALVEQRRQTLLKRSEATGESNAGIRLQDARALLREETHAQSGLLRRLRGRPDVRMFAALGEWVRWLPRFAQQERDTLVACAELELLDRLLEPVERSIEESAERAAAVTEALDQMMENAAQLVVPEDDEILLLPGGTTDAGTAGQHLCDELLTRHPQLDTLPGEVANTELLGDGKAEVCARQLLAWALPRCSAVRDRLDIDAVIADASPGTPAHDALQGALDLWLLPPEEGALGHQTLRVAGLPAHATDGDLKRLLQLRASEAESDEPEVFSLPTVDEVLLFTVDLGFPIGKLGNKLDTLRRFYEELRFGDETVPLHTRADVREWSSLEDE